MLDTWRFFSNQNALAYAVQLLTPHKLDFHLVENFVPNEALLRTSVRLLRRLTHLCSRQDEITDLMGCSIIWLGRQRKSESRS